MDPNGRINAHPRDVRILSLANITPYPAHGGIHLRILHVLKRIAQHHDVVLGCHVWDHGDRDSVAELNRIGLRTVGAEIYNGTRRQRLSRAIRGARRGIPPEASQLQTDKLHALVRDSEYDVLHIEETSLAPYLRHVPAKRRVRKVLTLHNVHFVQDRRIADISSSLRERSWKRLNASWMRHYEPRAAARFDRVVAVSEADRTAMLERDASLDVHVVPNGVDTRELRPLPPAKGRPAVLFVGSMGYAPCVDAAQWLVQDILPLMRKTLPDVEAWIVGRSPTAEVRALASNNVHVTGEVDDIRSYYERATVALVPLRAGGGSRLKILEAMALGRAVISTTIGAEGLELKHGSNVVIADSAADLARAACELIVDAEKRVALQQVARHTVEASFDWNDIADKQLAVYESLR